ncbi:hypothetical protein ACHAQH_005766 [Verticillium albo-atrum]
MERPPLVPPSKVPELWVPPSDPHQRKQELHWSKGQTIFVTPHKTPPAPFGGSAYMSDPNEPDLRDDWPILMKTTRSELVFQRFPRGTSVPQHSGSNSPTSATLEIEEQISTGHENGSQVVLCSVKNQLGSNFIHGHRLPPKVIAKIYDALYYPFEHSWWNRPVDVVTEADGEYSREVAAYKQLQKAGITGNFAPKYYGCWTTPVRSSSGRRYRPVCLILMEYIDGLSISSMCSQATVLPLQPGPAAGDAAQRMLVIQQLLEGLALMALGGVDERSANNDNVLVVRTDTKNKYDPHGKSRTVLVSYADAAVAHLTPRGFFADSLLDLPLSPIYEELDDDLMGWIPEEYYEDEDCKKWKEWLEEKFGGDNAKLYSTMEERSKKIRAQIAKEEKKEQETEPEVEGAAAQDPKGKSTSVTQAQLPGTVALPSRAQTAQRQGDRHALRKGSETSTDYHTDRDDPGLVERDFFDQPRKKE